METDRGKRPVSLADAGHRSARILGCQHTRGVLLEARGPPERRFCPARRISDRAQAATADSGRKKREGRRANAAPPLSDSRLASPGYS